MCRISDIFVLLRHESTAVTSRGLNSWWRGVERSIARKVGRRAAPELRGQAGRRGRRTPHGTRATDEEGSEHETVMYIGVCGAATQKISGASEWCRWSREGTRIRKNRGRVRGFAIPGVEIQNSQRLSEDLGEILITPRSSTRKQSLFRILSRRPRRAKA